MISTVNKVILIGNLGTDVKMHHFDANTCAGRFSLATSESYLNKSTNERVESVEWHNIAVFNKAAEICNKYLSKGDRIYIEGKLKTRKYTAVDGIEKYTTEIIAKEFKFLSTKKSTDNTAPSASNVPPISGEDSDDDLPF